MLATVDFMSYYSIYNVKTHRCIFIVRVHMHRPKQTATHGPVGEVRGLDGRVFDEQVRRHVLQEPLEALALELLADLEGRLGLRRQSRRL